jgi:hypothetical protein
MKGGFFLFKTNRGRHLEQIDNRKIYIGKIIVAVARVTWQTSEVSVGATVCGLQSLPFNTGQTPWLNLSVTAGRLSFFYCVCAPR